MADFWTVLVERDLPDFRIAEVLAAVGGIQPHQVEMKGIPADERGDVLRDPNSPRDPVTVRDGEFWSPHPEPLIEVGALGLPPGGLPLLLVVKAEVDLRGDCEAFGWPRDETEGFLAASLAKHAECAVWVDVPSAFEANWMVRGDVDGSMIWDSVNTDLEDLLFSDPVIDMVMGGHWFPHHGVEVTSRWLSEQKEPQPGISNNTTPGWVLIETSWRLSDDQLEKVLDVIAGTFEVNRDILGYERGRREVSTSRRSGWIISILHLIRRTNQEATKQTARVRPHRVAVTYPWKWPFLSKEVELRALEATCNGIQRLFAGRTELTLLYGRDYSDRLWGFEIGSEHNFVSDSLFVSRRPTTVRCADDP